MGQQNITLVGLVSKLKNREDAELFFSTLFPDVEIDLIDSFIKLPVNIKSEIIFFNIEKNSNLNMEIEIKGAKYVNLFPIGEMQSVIENLVLSHPNCNEADLAILFLQYRKAETPNWE